eukprot:TRINITY_DN8780_c0_g1_i1.p1 TRINITY_DN8780_c0_g1~~TRINITY_DN8780_c0_g1_i1.p1  ORF type:complete len:145 (+),score=27.15 TRINITY_DN8780_c0_g1_i1:56-436(+)
MKCEKNVPFVEQTIFHAVKASLKSLFGDAGAFALITFTFNPHTQIFSAKVMAEKLQMLWCAITMVSEIEGKKVQMTVNHVAGSPKSFKRVLIEFQKSNQEIANAWKVQPSETKNYQIFSKDLHIIL